jgi:hypothetical protein
MNKYILVNGEPVPEPDVLKWAKWFEDDESRVVARTKIDDIARIEEICVSTVFLGIDHNFFEYGPPILYETTIFGGDHNEDMWRYSTRADALHGHEVAVAHAKNQEYGPREWSPRWKKVACAGKKA